MSKDCDIANDLKRLNIKMDLMNTVLTQTRAILCILKDMIVEKDVSKDINFIKSAISAVQYSPRALSHSEAAVKNTQTLIKQMEEMLESTVDEKDAIYDKLDSLEDTIKSLTQRMEPIETVFKQMAKP